MTKHTVIAFLGILVAALPVLGFPPSVRTALLIVSGIVIAVLAYLSSVVYCSNCKKLISDAEQAFDNDEPTLPPNSPRVQ
jgi:hypothetical protein